MARRRTVGFVENEWVCPNCETRNKGSVKTCENCGAPQPDDVKFELASNQKMVTDEAAIDAAKAGADIHCGFCGTRNPGNAETCSQCGGDLSEGEARESGRVMQAPPPPPKVIKCENCETENPGTNSVCSNCGATLAKPQAPKPAKTSGKVGAAEKKPTNWKLIGGIAALLALCCAVVAFILLVPASSVEGTVADVYWQTNVPVQEIRSVDHSNERGNPPSGAYNVSCYDDSREVCEQKTIDQGNGYSEVVEDCHTETDKYCSYTVDEWTTIQTYTLEGDDLKPIYDSPNLASDQRLGEESEEFTVTFSTDDGNEVYSPGSISEFQQFTIGSTWQLKLNAIGGVVRVEK